MNIYALNENDYFTYINRLTVYKIFPMFIISIFYVLFKTIYEMVR